MTRRRRPYSPLDARKVLAEEQGRGQLAARARAGLLEDLFEVVGDGVRRDVKPLSGLNCGRSGQRQQQREGSHRLSGFGPRSGRDEHCWTTRTADSGPATQLRAGRLRRVAPFGSWDDRVAGGSCRRRRYGSRTDPRWRRRRLAFIAGPNGHGRCFQYEPLEPMHVLRT
jgi:hypothetical protein